jgi:drug/metabolite transporter (DMT)-like permease
MVHHHSIGLMAGLAAALVWAVAAVLFRRLGNRLPPLTLNLYKGLVAALGLVAVLAVWGAGGLSLPPATLAALLLSGMIGIGIGDTAFFAALNRLGERPAVIIAETMAPMITILGAAIVFKEHLSATALLGAGAIIAGIFLVLRDGSAATSTGDNRAGRGFAFMAAGCQAVGGLLSKAAFRMSDADPFATALVRLAGGLLLIGVLMVHKGIPWIPVNLSRRVWAVVVLASFIGTFGGLVLQQAAYKFTYTGVAQTLIATSAVFIMLITCLRGRFPAPAAWAGSFIATLGVAMLYLFNVGTP